MGERQIDLVKGDRSNAARAARQHFFRSSARLRAPRSPPSVSDDAGALIA